MTRTSHTLRNSIAIALAACIAFTLAACANFAIAQRAFASDGVECTIASVAQDAITWDSATNTVTINEANIDLNLLERADDDPDSLICLDGNSTGQTVTVDLIGESAISPTSDWGGLLEARWLNVAVTGTGKLTVIGEVGGHAINVHGGDLTLAGGSISMEGDGCNIDCYGDVTLDGSDITIKNIGGTNCLKCTKFKGISGTLWTIGSEQNGVYCKDFTLEGVSIGARNVDCGLYAYGSMDLRSGTVEMEKIEQAGIHVEKDLALNGAKVSIRTAERGVFVNEGAFTANSGSMSINECKNGILVNSGMFDPANTFTLNGATIGIGTTTYDALEAVNVTVKKGTLNISGCQNGIDTNINFVMTGGTVSVVDAKYIGIHGNRKLSITGGTLTAKCTTTRYYCLSCASGITNKPSCLKALYGELPDGIVFYSSGSTYVLNDDCLTLKTYGGTSKKPTVNKVKFAGKTYPVTTIGAKAFANAKGKAITQLTIGKNVSTIKAKAFYGTSKLATLNAKAFYYRSATIAKTAFSKCGKAQGRKLVVKCKNKADRKALRKLLVKKGLSKKATFK